MKKRYCLVDVAKFVAAILVITIHTNPFEKISEVVNFYLCNVISRLSVPFFILCSGYFIGLRLRCSNGKVLISKKNSEILIGYIKSYIKLYSFLSLVYLFILIPNWIKTGYFSVFSFFEFCISFFTKGTYYHLWYLLFMCYALFILWFLMEKLSIISLRQLGCIAVVLYSIEVLQYGYRIFLPLSIQKAFQIFDTFECLSAVTRVLPFLIIGIIMSQNNENNNRFLVRNFLLSLTGLFVEASILYFCFEKKSNFSYIVFTLLASCFLLRLLINYQSLQKIRNTKPIADISALVYYIHPAVIQLYTWLGIDSNIVIYAITTTTTLLISLIAIYIPILFKNAKYHNTCEK